MPKARVLDDSGVAKVASAMPFDKGTRTATASGNGVAATATLNKRLGVVTSEALTTASGADYTLTLTNNQITANDVVLVSVAYGTATTGVPTVARVQPGTNQVVIVIRNLGAAALNGTVKISFAVVQVF